MAAPVVAGAAALLLQARPDLNPDQVKALLTSNVNAHRRPATPSSTSPRRSPRNPGAGANQGVEPERRSSPRRCAAAGVDPTRATWTKATWTKATWTKATWTKATWTKATWTGGVAAPWAKATWTCAACDAARDRDDRRRARPSRRWSKSTWSKSTWSQ